MELVNIYRNMSRSREFELAVAELWEQGLITGEMHASTGEELVAAAVTACLTAEDSLSLTHRCSSFVVARGVPLVPVIKELLGREDGLCHGRGGHMHLFSRDYRIATSGIVGASLPTGAGFALAAKRLRPHALAVAQIGDGALNQGMALETLNLATVWKLPLLVVCIDNGWAITTSSESLTAGSLPERARSFGWLVGNADGADIEDVSQAAKALVKNVRAGKGPAFLYARCPRMDGHYLGDALVRLARHPVSDGRDTLTKVVGGAFSQGGSGLISRATGLTRMMGAIGKIRHTPAHGDDKDPLVITRKRLSKQGYDVAKIDLEAQEEIRCAVAVSLGEEHD
ncbi:hypothetical protein BTA51_13655 [Hahella sp. CCB-MM4]|uniref:thiamine pyrophosphate-dependent dehydrogenase E1 component subunit alpha n=1 Tax=Hahella sp. (strain CCB-MM4) TaxID=1926491 RepID=UPI000B9A7873|nr:thiamine pyrophosphate-dependent dehydrogenase E1 component subunit alpha [Hahella sp. CCB-MM4]OZG72995.1 hypothetical protein BTA51_13655 [Hahella sp. CCB-MM4]